MRQLSITFLLLFMHFSSYKTFLPINLQILENQTNLLEMEDNKDNNYIVTTKKLYYGLNPEDIISFEDELPINTVFTKFNSTHFLAICTKKSYLACYNTSSSKEYTIGSYSTFGVSLTNNICSLSFLDSYINILHTKIIRNNISLTLVKFKLAEYSYGIGLGGSPGIIHATIPLNTPENFSYISCVAISVLNGNSDSVFACSYIRINSTNNFYSYVATTGNFSSLCHLNEEITLFEREELLHFKMKRINNTFIRYLLGNYSYEIYLTKKNNNFYFNIVPEESRNEYLYKFNSYQNLFYYNNEYIFHVNPTDETNLNFNLYITNSISKNKLIKTIINKPIEKVSGFYDKNTHTFIYIYQYSNTIEYFILEQKCLYNAWHIFPNNSFICYENQNYCLTNKYYYHTNTRECVFSQCRDGYYKLGFECYKGNCPENTRSILSGDNKCESTFDYCYIDTNYKMHCSNEINNEYNLKYENSKIYFKNCEDSFYFYNTKTYLYQSICLKDCPTETSSNDEEGKCICNYFIYYLDTERTNYKCLLETETCKDLNKYSIEEKKECVDTRQECIEQGFKIFNEFCLSICPINTIIVGDNCECKYNYYKINETLNCFEEEKSCEDMGYPIMSNTNECFLTKEDCIKKGNIFFNNICYIGIDTFPTSPSINNISYYINKFSTEFIYKKGLTYDINIPSTYYIIKYSTEFIYKNKSELVEDIKESLINTIDLSKNNLIKDLEIKEENILIILTTTNLQKNGKNENKTTIDLGKCENKIKYAYNISYNNSLYIIKIDIKEEGMNIPKIEYELYYPLNKKDLIKLNLTACKGEKIEISIPVAINDTIDKYNSSSDYYNNICSKSSSEIDIPLSKRRDEFIDNNMTLCEENCELIEYKYDINKAICSCDIKMNIPLIDSIKFDTKKLYENFVNIKNILNLKLLKCYKSVFDINSLKNNFGFFIMDLIIILYFVCLIIFFSESFIKMKKEIKEIISSLKKDKKIEKDKKRNKNRKKNKPKRNAVPGNIMSLKGNRKDSRKLSIKKNKENDVKSENLTVINLNEDNFFEYKDFELNVLDYKKALQFDKRTFIQYYISLIKYNHLLIFSFYNNKDYNSRIIKMFLFFFFFSAYFTVNALFFSDNTMNKIYDDGGAFNFIYHIPQIIYSSIISGIISVVIKQLSFSQNIILELKNENIEEDLDKKEKYIFRILLIKFISFFIVTFILLMAFWYYITCFCGVYKNTQIILIKDTVISFSMSLVYPFIKYLIPGIFRIPSLKSENESEGYLYKLSLLFQYI